MLVENDPHFQVYLDLQHYDAEVADLTKKYGMPDGRLYVAWCDGQPAGCIALRRLDGTTCELKRLYVRPATTTARWTRRSSCGWTCDFTRI